MPLERNNTSDDPSVPLSEELVRGQLVVTLTGPEENNCETIPPPDETLDLVMLGLAGNRHKRHV